MAKNQRDFFKKKNEWSEIKDTLLRCYLPQYFQKLLVSGKPIFYIDCFAGKGKFDDGNDGSPLIAMQIINERLGMSRISRKNNAIVPCFIELNHAADLEQNLMLHPYQYGTPQVVDGKFEDNIRGLLKDKRGYDALIIDFFAGSGTTLHAVNLLNAEDGGHRRCILVTNNEVSADEAKALTERGFQPGDEEWNKLGIARYVTWPRTVCSIEGHDVNGKPLKGDYITSGEEPMHMADGFKANAAFFKLGFLDKNAVALGRQFKELLPVLWLKAGAHGPCPALEETAEAPDMLVLPVNRFAVLTDESQYEEFAARVNGEDSITTVYIVTDSEPGYREMVSGLHAEDTYQLYRDYLDNFRINHGGR